MNKNQEIYHKLYNLWVEHDNLMGDKVEPRRKWIEDNVKFTLEENTVFQAHSF